MTSSIDQSIQRLGHLGLGKRLRHIRTAVSSVTTEWGVKWDEVLIARDILQNFFDANRDRLSEVHVRVDGKNVVISAPTAFELDRLFYLGSEKTSDDIGQYGEGFKAASLCLLRDFHVTPIAASEGKIVSMKLSNEPAVPGSKLFPIVYDFFESGLPTSGARLILPDCTPALIDNLRAGFSHFLHDGNLLVGDQVWRSWDGSFAIHASRKPEGYVFYRRLMRGKIPDIPIVLVINKSYARLEKKISHDRDRKAFGEELMAEFYRYFARAIGTISAAQLAILEAAKNSWEKGHPLLRTIADTNSHPGVEWAGEAAAALFGDRLFADSAPPDDPYKHMEIMRIEHDWKRSGRRRVPGYFRSFGVPSAVGEIDRADAEAKRKALQSATRTPTRAEAASVEVLSAILQELAPEVFAVFRSGKTAYLVVTNDALLGELRMGRRHGSREVLLADELFLDDFSTVLAVFLHEHGHVFGYDGSRGFTDGLTSLIERLVAERGTLDAYEACWKDAREDVRRERGSSMAESQREAADKLSALDAGQLKKLLEQLPGATLRRLMKE